jgi:hypothetical protein
VSYRPYTESRIRGFPLSSVNLPRELGSAVAIVPTQNASSHARAKPESKVCSLCQNRTGGTRLLGRRRALSGLAVCNMRGATPPRPRGVEENGSSEDDDDGAEPPALTPAKRRRQQQLRADVAAASATVLVAPPPLPTRDRAGAERSSIREQATALA